MFFYEFIKFVVKKSSHKKGKGKTIAGVTSQFYHRGFIIAVISLQL
jgi:hypothetical protein